MKFKIPFFLCNVLLLFCYCSCNTEASKPAHPSGYTNDTAAVNTINKKAASFLSSNIDSVYYYVLIAEQQAGHIKYANGMARAKSLEVAYLRRKGLYAKAIALNLEVNNILDSLGNLTDLSKNQDILADMYKELGGEKKTIEYLQTGIELTKQAEQNARQENFYEEVAYALNERGIIYRDMSQINNRSDLMDSAFAMYEQAIEIATTKEGASEPLNKLYNNISQVYNEYYKNYPKALEYLQKAVAINKANNRTRSLSFNYGNISDVYMNMGDLQKANEYAQLTYQLCKQINSPHRLQNAYSQLTRVNKAMQRYDSALYYKEMFITINDSLTNLDRTQQIADVQTKYETREKESEITQLNANVKTRSQQFYWALGIGVLLAGMIGLMWYQNRELARQKAKIAEQSNRLQWMMKELHHRVKNNLQIVSSLLNLQSYRLSDEESISAFKESQLRVQAMSLMHQRLYQVEDVSMVNFRSYIIDLAETLMKSYGYEPDEFDLQTDIDKELMDVDTVMPLGLLVNEIMTNAFKYAYKEVERPLLHIQLKSGDNKIQLTIKDNGPGIIETTSTKPGFGKKLIAALSKQLKATYSVTNDNGTVYRFQIPYQQDKAA